MAKHTNKILCGLLALSASFVLAACDTVNALPTNYEEPIVNRVGEGEYKLDDNQLGKIWEAIVTGKAEHIHNELIYQIAKAQFGTYFTESEEENVEKGISEISGEADKKEFIAKHTAVFARDDDSKLAGSGDVEEIRIKRFDAFKKDIEERLAEKLYGEITSGNYNVKDGRFSELKLALAHYTSGYEVTGIGFPGGVASEKIYSEEGLETTESWYKDYITASVVKDDLESIKKVVHIENFKKYLEKKVLRDIYSEKLIEEYVVQNKYSTLGRAYARHVSYVKLSYSDENKVFADTLLRYYADDVIVNEGETSGKAPNEEKVANTWRGLKNLVFTDGKLTEIDAGTADESYTASLPGFTTTTIVDQLAAEKKLDGTTPKYGDAAAIYTKLSASDEEKVALTYPYIKESKVGALLEKYRKACRAVMDGANHIADDKDQTELDSFTKTNEQSRVKGLKEELSKLVLEDYTVDEWGLKNGGFSDLPSGVRDRLFNINVANAVDNFDSKEGLDYVESDDTKLGHYAKSGKYSYVRYVKGYYYLNKADAQRYEDDPHSYIFDEDNSYVVVNIKDAANSTKLNIDNDDSYFKKVHTDQPLFTENTAREIAKLLGTKESYKNDAYESYLEKYNLKFSDQELYDYFVAQYPDLYGED